MKIRNTAVAIALAAIATSALSPAALAQVSAGMPQASMAKAGPKLKLRIAVNQGKWSELQYSNYEIGQDTLRSLQARIIEKLQRTGMFEILERESNSDMQRRAEEGVAAERDARAQTQGRQPLPMREVAIPADFIITPEVVGFKVTSKSSGGIDATGILNKVGGGIFGKARVDNSKTKATAEISLRIFSAETSSMVDIASGKGEEEGKTNKSDLNIFGAGLTQEKINESPAGKAVDEAIDDAVNQMIARLSKMPWKATIAAISSSTGRVTINRGTASGITPGMEFAVYSADDNGTDPETGLPIPGDEVLIGRVRVVRVDGNFSFAEIVSGKNIKRLNIVRLP